MDGLVDQDDADLRILALEKKVSQQDDEIVCLKSALSDALRRLAAVETSRASNTLPNKPHVKNTPRRANVPTRTDVSPRAATPDFSSSHRSHPPSPKLTPKSRQSARKWPSSSTDLNQDTPHRNYSIYGLSNPDKAWNAPPTRYTSMVNLPSYSNRSHLETVMENGRYTPSRHSMSPATRPDRPPSRSAKEPGYNDAEAALKMYMKGRPLHLVAPSKYAEDYDVNKKDELPAEKLQLEWVYGYRGRDCRHNLYLLPTGEVIYFIASVVVLYSVDEHTQRHYTGHNDDVKCLAVHPDKITIASGQVAGHEKKAGKPHVRVWDSISLNTLHVIGLGDFERAVACVGFSKLDGGQFLCAVDESNEHVLSVWDWAKGEGGSKMAETKSSTDTILVADFHPLERNEIILTGKNQMTFWTIENGCLTKKQGIYEKHEKPKYVLCVAFTDNGDVLSGDSNGNIFLWGRGGNRITQHVYGAHEGGIFALCMLKDGTIVSGGGKDRRIVQWTSSLERTGLEAELPDAYGPVRTLCQGKGNMIVVGTTRNCILSGTLDFKFSAIVQGHTDEVWGIAAHPSQHQFITCSYDKHVFLWDTLTHSAVWFNEVNEGAHCASFHPNASVIVIGTQSGRWHAIDSSTRDTISTHHDGIEQLECIEFSPDGERLAVGSRDNGIYVYKVSEDGRKYQKVGKCVGHSSYVTHLDWSADSQHLRTNSGDYEILYWSGSSCKQVFQSSTLKDTEWATQNCTLDFTVAGIWPENADGTDVNACTRSNNQTLVASADDYGKVNLFTYPCCHLKAPSRSYGGHSSHVTNVRFLYDDSRLLSVGGKDMAILQWQINE